MKLLALLEFFMAPWFRTTVLLFRTFLSPNALLGSIFLSPSFNPPKSVTSFKKDSLVSYTPKTILSHLLLRRNVWHLAVMYITLYRHWLYNLWNCIIAFLLSLEKFKNFIYLNTYIYSDDFNETELRDDHKELETFVLER